MPRPVKASRTYRSPVRQQQAESTRRRVVEAAQRLFVERGYAGTTIAAVAEAAGVSPETIYASLGGKRGLLAGVIEATIDGPEGPAQRQVEFDRIAALPTPRERLGGFVEFACRVLERTSPLHAVIRAAADTEPFAVELQQRLLRERLDRTARRVRADLEGALRPGLTVRRAAERLGALLSPELYHLLTVQLGWSSREHRRWVLGVAEADLLGSA